MVSSFPERKTVVRNRYVHFNTLGHAPAPLVSPSRSSRSRPWSYRSEGSRRGCPRQEADLASSTVGRTSRPPACATCRESQLPLHNRGWPGLLLAIFGFSNELGIDAELPDNCNNIPILDNLKAAYLLLHGECWEAAEPRVTN